MPKQPVAVIRSQTGDYDALAARITALIRAKLAGWDSELVSDMTVEDLRRWFKARSKEIGPQVRAAFKDAGLLQSYSALTTEAMLEAVVIGYGPKIPAPTMQASQLLNKKMGATIPLSKRIWNSSKTAQSEVMSVLSDGLIARQGWTKTALDISAKQISSGNITKKMDELVVAAKRAGIDAASLADYKRSLRAAQRHVEGLALSNAPTGYLKSSYQAVIDATLTKSSAVIEKKIAAAVKDKIRYEAERLVRTETARAYGVSVYNSALEDDAVVGVRSTLSSRHPAEDICNFYAEVDLFGMGPGVYPKTEAPAYPYHPNCLCNLTPVYKSELPSDSINEEAAAEWIGKQSEETQQALLGKAGVEAFTEDNAAWKENLRGWNGLENKRIVAL